MFSFIQRKKEKKTYLLLLIHFQLYRAHTHSHHCTVQFSIVERKNESNFEVIDRISKREEKKLRKTLRLFAHFDETEFVREF